MKRTVFFLVIFWFELGFASRPKGEVTYCPPFDSMIAVISGIERARCLNSLTGSSQKSNIDECLVNSTLENYFSQLQLMGLSSKCVKSKLDYYMEYKVECYPQPSPCGQLGDFIREVDQRKLGVSYDVEDGKGALLRLVEQ